MWQPIYLWQLLKIKCCSLNTTSQFHAVTSANRNSLWTFCCSAAQSQNYFHGSLQRMLLDLFVWTDETLNSKSEKLILASNLKGRVVNCFGESEVFPSKSSLQKSECLSVVWKRSSVVKTSDMPGKTSSITKSLQVCESVGEIQDNPWMSLERCLACSLSSDINGVWARTWFLIAEE